MTAKLFDRCMFVPTLAGLTDWVVASVVTGYMTPASAGVANGDVVYYVAETSDRTEWELGQGAYTSGSTTLARTTILFSSNANAKVNFVQVPRVYIVLPAEFLASMVNGPAGATNNHVVFFDGATGFLIKDSGLTLSGTNTGDQTLPVGANPTGQVDGSAHNGSAGTWMRSDAAPKLADTAVTAASYGDSTHWATFTVDAQGRLTAAASVATPAVPVGANPTATGGDVAVNGSAGTWMRSDGAPAIQKGSSSAFGILKVDNTTITASSGVISTPGGANPSATAKDTAVNGSATTFMRSDAAPAIQKASSSQFGLVEVDGTTITASGGVISAAVAGLTALSFHPGYVSGLYYSAPRLTIQNTGAGNNTLHAVPFYCGSTVTFTKAAINVTSGATAATEVTIGLYANSSGVPGALLQAFGHLPTTGTGVGELTGLTISLTPGWYWLAVVGNNVNPQLSGGSGTTSLLDFLCGTSSIPALGGGYTGTFTYSSGSLPNPFPSPALSTNSTQPYVFLRF